ncbi:hypothetical protein KAS41_00165 [Candidatus Parcubacteria bacterium]|nr:hypothetical protein [Candidatus Parcubacteria bacterium]
MNKKLAKIIWSIIIILFIGMEIYHLAVGNYDDFTISILIVIGLLGIFGIYFLINRSDKK